MVLQNTGMVETSVMQPETPESSNNQDWFEEFIESYDYSQPKRGHIFEGQIVRIDADAVVVDIGLKRDGIVPGRDLSLLDPEVRENLAVGDQVIVAVLATPVGDQDLLVSLHKGYEHLDWQKAEVLLEGETIVDLEVVAHNKGGLLVRYGALRGFVPASQVPDLRRLRDAQRLYRAKQALVGEKITLKAVEVDRQRRRLVFSSLAAQSDIRKQRLKQLEKGQIIIQAKIVSVVDFGVFVDLGDIDGLVHISELDWQKLRHPSQQFRVGEEIDVKILDIDVEDERVSLSRKALLPNPLEALLEKYKPGQVISGKITNILDFGAFVRLEPQVVGLVHTSELGYSASGKPQDLVKVGEKVLVRVLDISPSKGRISLSMRRVPRDEQIAWMAAELEKEAASVAVSAADTVEVVSEITVGEEDGETPPLMDEAPVSTPKDQLEEHVEEQVEAVSQDSFEVEPDAEVEQSTSDTPEAELEMVPEAELDVDVEESPTSATEDHLDEQDEAASPASSEAEVQAVAEERADDNLEDELEIKTETEVEAEVVEIESASSGDSLEGELAEPEPDDPVESKE